MNKKLALIVIVLSLFLVPNINKAQAGLWDGTPFQAESFSITKSLFSFINSDKPLIQKREEPQKPTIIETVKEDLARLLKTYEVKSKYVVSVSAYSSEPWQTDDTPFITASNTHVRDGVVAANFLPFGTLIRLPEIYGDKIFIVEDRMNRRYWFNLDIWFDDTQLAREFGRKTVTIEVL